MGRPPIRACPFCFGFVVVCERRMRPAQVPHVGFFFLDHSQSQLAKNSGLRTAVIADWDGECKWGGFRLYEFTERSQETFSFGDESDCGRFASWND
jgi:hypothetical protein